MQMRFAAMATFAAAAMAIGASANATVLFNDDFSQDTLTEHPALQGGEVGLKWQTRTPVIPSGDPNIPSSPDPAHAHRSRIVTDDPDDGTNKHLLLDRPDANSWGYSHAQLTNAATSSTADGIVEISFRLFIENTGGGEFRLIGNTSNAVGDVFDPTGNTGAAIFNVGAGTGNAFSIRFVNNANPVGTARNVTFHGGSIVQDTGTDAKFLVDEWNDVLVTVDYALGQFQVQLTNSLGTTLSDIRGFTDTDADRLGTVQFTVPGNNTLARVDDVVVTLVPEPASLALLGLGGLMALRRSRS